MYHMFKTRMAALKSRKIELNYFKEYTGEIPTNVRIAGRHFENQFQAPILFYILGLTILVSKVKKLLKKILPKKIISYRQDLLQLKKIRSDVKMNWFVNNTGDNCYIRGILQKK